MSCCNKVKQAIEDNVCVMCTQPVLSFEDAFSERFYVQTGVCENCQNDLMKKEDADE